VWLYNLLPFLTDKLVVVEGDLAARLSKTVPGAFTRPAGNSSISSNTEVLTEEGKLVEARAVKLSVNY
jgi:hypothetical protein